LSLAEFRVGHYEEAERWARRAVKDPLLYPKACASAILAMCQFKLNQADDANAALAKCNNMIEQQLPKPGEDLSTDWRDWIIAHALQAEAKRMIEGEPSSAAP
jgi:Tfp pilus assembly protein PilF